MLPSEDGLFSALIVIFMPIHTHPQYREPVLILRAVGNERRYAIIVLLLQCGTLTGADIAEKLQVHFTVASKHLHRLLRAGIVVSKRNGGSVEFRLAPDFRKKLQKALDPLL